MSKTVNKYNTIHQNNDVKSEKKYLTNKRNAIIAKLFESGYSFADIGVIFRMNRSSVLRIIDKK